MPWPSSSTGSSRPSSVGFSVSLSDRIVPWMLFLTVVFFAALVVALLSGCAARTILVPESAPIRIGPETRGRIYAREDGEWVLGDNRVTIPEGWYCVPPSFVEE